MVLWEAGKLASIFGHVHIIITQHALIYALNYISERRHFEYQETKPSIKLAPAIFPVFHCVSLSVIYTFHPTTFFQTGVVKPEMDCVCFTINTSKITICSSSKHTLRTQHCSL